MTLHVCIWPVRLVRNRLRGYLPILLEGECLLRTIIVDDEPLALFHMERLLQEVEVVLSLHLEIVGTFKDPRSALDFAQYEPLQLAFVDIEMPEMNGLQLAQQLVQLYPHIHVIFITAYRSFEIESFALIMDDCLFKPVLLSKLSNILQRIASCNPPYTQ